MPLINLIHEQRLLVRQRERQVRVLVLATIGLGAFAFLGAGYFVFEAARYQVMIGSLETKKRSLQPLLKQLKANELDEKQLEPKLLTLTSATKATEQWSGLLNHLTLNVPSGVWLRDIKTASQPDQDGGIQITFSGCSVTQQNIGELLLRLETCQELENVTLRFSQERMLDKGIKVLEFEVGAYLAGSKATKKSKEKETA